MAILAALLAAPASASPQFQVTWEDGGWLPFSEGAAPAPPAMHVVTAGALEVRLQAGMPGVWAETIDVAGRRFTRLFGDGYGISTPEGLPNLPVLRRDVEIPFGARVTLEVVSATYEDIALETLGMTPVYPTQPSIEKLPGALENAPFVIDEDFYSEGGFYTAGPVALDEAYVIRGHRVQPVAVTAVAYNPSAGTLRLYRDVTFRLRLEGSDMEMTAAMATRYASPLFEERLAAEVLNYNQGGPTVQFTAKDPVGYLIIVEDDYYDALLPFVSLRESRGFDVTATKVSEIPGSATTTNIKAYIQDAYDTWPLPPSYLLLVGDTNTIPAWSSTQSSGKYTDLYYSTMDGGSDWHPDLGRGRFPVRSADHTTAMVDKYVNYSGLTGVEEWLKKIAFIGTCDNYPVAEGTHNYVVNTHTNPAHYSGIFPNNPQSGGDKLYCVTYDATANDIRASLNDDRWAVIYSGHGGEDSWADGYVSFSQNDVRNLTSTVLPFVGSHACVTGSFVSDECYGETWVRKENGGSLVFWGGSHNTLWDEDDVLERAMFDALFTSTKGYPDVAAMTDYALDAVENSGTSYDRYYWEAYNVLGDPAVKIFMEPDLPTFTMSMDLAEAEICQTGTVTTLVTIGSVLNYTDTVYLMHGPMDAGMGMAFDPDSGAAPFASEMTMTVAAGAAAGLHTMMVTATDQVDLTFSEAMNVYVFAAEPGAVTLTTPADGATDVAFRPALAWDDREDASGYRVQLGQSPHFNAPLLDASTGAVAYNLTETLAGGACYWWRVQGDNVCGDGAWAEPYHFATVSLAAGFTDNMETGEGQWSHAAAQGTDSWEISDAQSYSPLHAWFVPDSGSVTDSRLWMTNPVPLGAGSTLSFWHRHQFEGTSYDGAVLEISTNDGAVWTDLNTYITQNGYGGQISTCCSNPLGGRQAWTGDLNEWTEVTVDLSAFAGETAQIRWRLGCDSSVSDTGWYIDDVQITAPMAPNPAPTFDSVAPDHGTGDAGVALTLSGADFLGVPAIKAHHTTLGDTWLLSPTVVNTTTVTAVMPAGMAEGTYDLLFFNGDCQEATLLQSYTVEDACEPLTSVDIAGPAVVQIGETETYSVTYEPATATGQVTFTWSTGAMGDTADYTWATTGAHTVVVTGTNPCSARQATLPVAVYRPLTDVVVNGPARLTPGEAGVFTVAPTPVDATLPVTYTWTGGALGATATYSWTVKGIYTVTVTAEQVYGAVVTRDVVVEVATFDLFLPLVFRD
ncbi:MAG: choice-of-anchor J domain-containing protein [Anaerolineae bacterium]|nr:choice-of-anchor J domain-containing protein [Anaerolineae bacterium]